MNLRESFGLLVRSLQHRTALALGVDERHRADTVVAMLANNQKNAPGYWIQLLLSMGIATLGLVLSSTAVVIGAMLVSPLMGPIVELGMGFTVGSSFLVIRASMRVLLSVVVVVAGAAVLTVLLPFHEVTAEIAARAAPTALDLLVAVFCALTAAYTTVRTTSDTTSAAAGTAIGIALVPPLCATGFGIGTGLPAIAGGAALLFTANLSAILVFSIASFLALGYNQVDALRVEDEIGVSDATRADVLAARGQTALQRVFGSRYGLAMRVCVPLLFLAAVYFPLRNALNEVTWEVRARDDIRRILVAEAPRAVQSSVVVERHSIALHLLLVTSTGRAAEVERVIRERIEQRTGVSPEVNITAVPDANALAQATRAATLPTNQNVLDLARINDRIDGALEATWPTTAAGPLLGWELLTTARGTPTLITYHVGDSLARAGTALLASSIGARLGTTVDVADSSLATPTIDARLGAEAQWANDVRRRLAWMAHARNSAACGRGPIAPTRRLTAAQRDIMNTIAQSSAGRDGRILMRDSTGWRMTLVRGACADTTA